ncbi:hypothetical protein FQA39_LY04620 [Lamprigera yunnana]|nr:hypothetical protein FQA39_LY04620 [Lamprigera yunnana]
MNVFKRGMIFVTFFGSCVAIVLLVASLGTKQWVTARAKRTINPLESDGRIQFGLFEGRKELNVAYGWRSYEIDVIHLIKSEPEFLTYGLWIGTIVSVSLGLLFSAICGVFAAVNAATTPSSCLAGVRGLYIWNFLALIADLCAIGFWIAQFFLSIQKNVMSREDKDYMWTSEDMAELGYSFWYFLSTGQNKNFISFYRFVVGAAIATFVDIIIIFIANSESKEAPQVFPVLEEKTNGAIMLY